MLTLNLQKKLWTVDGEIFLDIQCKLPEHQFIAVYGRSGVGKTTLLRILAGLIDAEQGFIKVGEEVWYDSAKKIFLPPQKRRIGFVFQDYALFPNMTVRKNIEFALNNKKQQADWVDEILEFINLKNLQDRKPATLSGGQKQRVALGRALAIHPKILLLDEPLSALDPEMRIKLQEEILRIHRRFQLTTLFVSHDLQEIFKLAQQVLMIDQGKIVRQGSPTEVFMQEKMSEVFKFVGEIIEIQKNEMIYLVSVLTGNHLVKAVATEKEGQDLAVGDKVMIISSIFNPLIKKISNY
ncbi:MAG: ATP-binding cassette domain-containing protein [Planctomycetota bacterium]